MRGHADELPADLALRVAVVAGQSDDDRADRACRAAPCRDRAADVARRAGIDFDLASVDADLTGVLLLAGYPDRLAARRRPGQFQLRTGTTAWLADDDPLAHAGFVVAADLDGRRSGARIRLAAAVDASDIGAVLDDVVEHRRLVWDPGRDDLVLRVERRLDALTLGEDVRSPIPGEDTADALVARVKATKLAVLDWTPAAVQLRARVAFLRAITGGQASAWPDLSDRALLASLDTWLRPYLSAAIGRGDLRRLDVATLLRAQLPWPLGADLDTLAPASWTLPGGRSRGDRLHRRSSHCVGSRPGCVRRDRAPATRRRHGAPDTCIALPRRSPDPGDRRPARFLGGLVGGGAQGPGRALPEASLAGEPGQRATGPPQTALTARARGPRVNAAGLPFLTTTEEVTRMSETKTMTAVVCHGPKDYRLEEVPIPERGPGEALIEVEAVGICASDLKCFNGAVKFWGDANRPAWAETNVIPGHEFVGVVTEIDDAASRRSGVEIGDRVVSEQIVPCWQCRYCRRGQYWMCATHNIYGFKRATQGGMASHMVFPVEALVHTVSKGSATSTRRVHRTTGVFTARGRARRHLLRRRRGRRRVRADRPRHDRRRGGEVTGTRHRPRRQHGPPRARPSLWRHRDRQRGDRRPSGVGDGPHRRLRGRRLSRGQRPSVRGSARASACCASSARSSSTACSGRT